MMYKRSVLTKIPTGKAKFIEPPTFQKVRDHRPPLKTQTRFGSRPLLNINENHAYAHRTHLLK